MEESYPKTENNSENMQVFRDKMRELKHAEEEEYARTGRGSAHFQGINPDDLLEEDADIYYKYLNNSLTRAEYSKYREQFKNVSIENSRNGFSAYIGNKITPRFMQEDLEIKN